MKFILGITGLAALFILALVGLRGTLGVLVDQAAGRTVESASVDVQFTLIDAAGAPLPGATVRLVVGPTPQTRPTSTGESFTTDAQGQHRFSTTAPIDKMQKRMPTNFLDTLFSRPKLTDHLSVGAELQYLSYRWLYVADFYRFIDSGSVLFEGLNVYTPDAQGYFTNRAVHDDTGWRMTELGDLRLTTAGNELSSFSFDRKDPAKDEWTLALTFTRMAEPVRH